MNPARFTVKRPVFTLMMTLIVILLGLTAFIRLPVDLMPDISYPTISISTTYQSSSPEAIEQLITRPLEEAMSVVPGIEEISSVSTEGSSRVSLSFAWGSNLEEAVDEVRERLDRVLPALPSDADRPRLWKFDPSNFPIMIVGISGPLDLVSLRRLVDEQVVYRLERIPGVAAVDVWGGREREIHVDILPDRLRALDIPLEQVVASIKAANVDLPAGQFERGDYQVGVRVPVEYQSLDELANTVIAVRQGNAIRINQIAVVEDTWQKVRSIARINGEQGIRISVSKQSGKNTVEVAKEVARELERIQTDIPQLGIMMLRDSSEYIRRSIRNVGTAAALGGLFTVLVLLFFLRSASSSAIIATAIPISIITTFALMYFTGYTLNIMSLGGIALGIGMLVDSSIVVIENIYRQRESGLGRREAAMEGTGEVSSAIIASTFTTVAVFIPFIFIRGIAGVMFKQLAVVVSFSLACSLLVALTLVPMLASRFLGKGEPSQQQRRIDQRMGGYENRHNPSGTGPVDSFRSRLEKGYGALLRRAIHHPGSVIFVSILILGMSLALAPFVGVELMPVTDESEVRVSGEMDTGTKLSTTDEAFRVLEPMVHGSIPEAEGIITSIGGGGWRGRSTNTGQIWIRLRPRGRRNRSDQEIASSLQRQILGIPGLRTRVRTGGGFFLFRLGSSNTEQVQIEIRGYDLEKSYSIAEQVQNIAEEVEGVADVRLSRETGAPEIHVLVNRTRASDLNLTVSQVSNTLQTVLSGTVAGNLREGGSEYNILVKLRGAEQMSMEEILDLPLRNLDGVPVVMRNIVQVSPRTGPVSIERKNQERVLFIYAQIRDRDMGSVTSDIKERISGIPLPEGFSILFGGDYAEQQRAFRELALSVVLALILVFMVMASLYESFRYPLVVMFSVPFAVIGVVIMLFLTGTTFNIQSGIGVLMLGGIVVNNAIILVDHINLLRRRDRMGLEDAIMEAGRRRIRPILMTSITTMLALTPLALGLGEGGEAQAPLARAVVGGLLSSTLITLLLIPTVYYLFERRRTGRDQEV